MKKKIIFSIVSIVALIFIISCQKEETYKNKYQDYQTFSSADPVCGDYVVNWYQGGALVIPGTTILSIYNTSTDASKIWVDDNGQFWNFKTKANLSGTAFGVTNGIEVNLGDTTTITKGSVSGDAIYLELKWSTDPTNTYVCKGTRRTGRE